MRCDEEQQLFHHAETFSRRPAGRSAESGWLYARANGERGRRRRGQVRRREERHISECRRPAARQMRSDSYALRIVGQKLSSPLRSTLGHPPDTRGTWITCERHRVWCANCVGSEFCVLCRRRKWTFSELGLAVCRHPTVSPKTLLRPELHGI